MTKTPNFTKPTLQLCLSILSMITLVQGAGQANAQIVFDFEAFPLATNSFNNGDPTASSAERAFFDNVTTTNFDPELNLGIMTEVDQTVTFSQNGADLIFQNRYVGVGPNAGFAPFFNGGSVSNVTNTITAGVANQYAAFPGSGAGGSANYLVFTPFPDPATFDPTPISIQSSRVIQSLDIAPTTFTALALIAGDDGGAGFVDTTPIANSGGFFEVIISDALGNEFDRVSFGDFRDALNPINTPDQFQTIDVSALNTNELLFTFAGSDAGTFGINTPLFFAADNIVVSAVPEPSSLMVIIGAGGLCLLRRRRSMK